jgi:hypothetical protein
MKYHPRRQPPFIAFPVARVAASAPKAICAQFRCGTEPIVGYGLLGLLFCLTENYSANYKEN